MRVFQVENYLPANARAVGSIHFVSSGAQIIAHSGFFTQRICHAPRTIHFLDIRSDSVRKEELDQHWYDPVTSPDGRFTAALAGDLRLRELWANDSGRWFRLNKRNDSPVWLGFAPDGNLYAAAQRDERPRRAAQAHLFRVEPEHAIREFDRQDALKTRLFPDSPALIAHGILERVGRIPTLLLRGAPPAFTADSQILAVWSQSGPVLILDANNGRTIHDVPWTGRAIRDRFIRHCTHRLALSANGERIALIGGGLLVCHRLDGKSKPWRTKKPIGYVTGAVFHPDGRTLLVVDRNGQAFRLDVAIGKTVAAWDWKLGMLLCVAVSPDGMVAAAGGEGGNVVLWDLDE